MANERGMDESGYPVITSITSELKPLLDSINEVIGKYNLNNPEKNICPMWFQGKITIAFSDPAWK